LFATGYVVNVGRGTVFAFPATALNEFRTDPSDVPRGTTASVVLHTAPGSAQPNLGDALTDPARSVASANVQTGSGVISADYAAPEHAVDAVSAALAASEIRDEYTMAAAEGSTTSIVFTYPTRRFYTDPAFVGMQAVAPFSTLFAGIQHDAETESVPAVVFDRRGATPHFPCSSSGCDVSMRMPGTSIELLELGAGADALLGTRYRGGGGLEFNVFEVDPNGNQTSEVPVEGWIVFNFDGSMRTYYGAGADVPGAVRFTRVSLDGKYFAGMPVVGFAMQNLINGNAQPGLLANYSSAVPHRALTACVGAPSGGGLAPQPCH
jgi:hypothetical protein